MTQSELNQYVRIDFKKMDVGQVDDRVPQAALDIVDGFDRKQADMPDFDIRHNIMDQMGPIWDVQGLEYRFSRMDDQYDTRCLEFYYKSGKGMNRHKDLVGKLDVVVTVDEDHKKEIMPNGDRLENIKYYTWHQFERLKKQMDFDYAKFSNYATVKLTQLEIGDTRTINLADQPSINEEYGEIRCGNIEASILTTAADIVLNKMDRDEIFGEDTDRITTRKGGQYTNEIEFIMDGNVMGRAKFEIKHTVDEHRVAPNYGMRLPTGIKTEQLTNPHYQTWKTLESLDNLAYAEEKAFTESINSMPGQEEEEFMHAVDSLSGDGIWQGASM